MPRKKRSPEISGLDLQQIERQAILLGIALRGAEINLKPFCPHYDAVGSFHDQIRVHLNLLNNRPAEFVQPHVAPMSGGAMKPPETT